MKKTALFLGIAFVVLGLLISIGPYTIFHVCNGHMQMEGEGMKLMACQKTAQAELVLGIIIALLGLINIFIKKNIIKGIANIANIITGVLAIAFVTDIIGTCKDPNMHCNIAAKPSLIVLGILTILVSLIGSFLTFKKKDESVYEEIEQEITNEEKVHEE